MAVFIYVVILSCAIVYLEWQNTKLENDIELLKCDVSCEKLKSKWFTFAEKEPRQNEWFIIKKRLTNDEIKQYGITNERLMYDVYVGHLDSDNVFNGGDNFSTFVMKLDELKTKGFFLEICMSFLKAIESGKEHRKPYRGSKIFDKTCRNHGACPYCKGNRLHNGTKRKKNAELSINEFLSEV